MDVQKTKITGLAIFSYVQGVPMIVSNSYMHTKGLPFFAKFYRKV